MLPLKNLSRLAVVVVCAALCVSCNLPARSDAPLNLGFLLQTPRPTYVLVVPGATQTPTPFQPLAVHRFETALPEQQTATPTAGPPLPTSAAQDNLDQLPNQFNILLLGSDKRPWDVGFRTDTIILLTLNKDHASANLTSFPRDLYITIPGLGMGRINTVFGSGGFALLADTLEYNFGVHPDYYMLVNFSSFKQIVDSLGGLDVKVAEPLADYRAGYWVSIPAGDVHMDADLALWYVRSRATSNDFERNRRQQEVIQALYEKFLSMNALQRAPEFYQVYKDNVETNISLVNILSWLPLAARIAEARNIHQYFIGKGQVYDYMTAEGGMVLLPDPQAVMKIIRKSQNLE